MGPWARDHVWSHILKCDRWAPLLYSSLFYFIFSFSDKHSSFSFSPLLHAHFFSSLFHFLSPSLLPPLTSPLKKLVHPKKPTSPAEEKVGSWRLELTKPKNLSPPLLYFLNNVALWNRFFFPCYNFFCKTLWSTEIYASFVLCVRTLNFISCYAF